MFICDLKLVKLRSVCRRNWPKNWLWSLKRLIYKWNVCVLCCAHGKFCCRKSVCHKWNDNWVHWTFKHGLVYIWAHSPLTCCAQILYRVHNKNPDFIKLRTANRRFKEWALVHVSTHTHTHQMKQWAGNSLTAKAAATATYTKMVTLRNRKKAHKKSLQIWWRRV